MGAMMLDVMQPRLQRGQRSPASLIIDTDNLGAIGQPLSDRAN